MTAEVVPDVSHYAVFVERISDDAGSINLRIRKAGAPSAVNARLLLASVVAGFIRAGFRSYPHDWGYTLTHRDVVLRCWLEAEPRYSLN
jgi:hypothetical protein